MRLNVDTLGTFYEMAREGAGLAADRLTAMTGVPTRVGVTRLNFMRRETLAEELDDGRQKVGVSVPFVGSFSGESLVVFDADSARRLARELVADVPADGVENIGDSALAEVSQIMSSGFVDGWAEVLGTAIDIETPEFVVDVDPGPFLERAGAGSEDLVLLFQSRIEAVGTEIEFRHFLFPDHAAVETLLEQSDDDGIEYDKLVGFNRMAQQGAAEVADNLTQLTGLDMTVSIQRINFLSLDTIPEEIPNERLISVAFEFTGTPSGYLVFVYGEESARGLVEATLPGQLDDDGDGLGEMGRDAIGEFSNIMASGFLDGWANVLDTTIEHTTPRYTHDLGAAVVDPLVIGLSRDQEFAFVFDTNVEAVERSFDVDVYAIPDEADLERALSALDLRRVGEAPTEAEFEEATTDHDAIDSIRDLEVE